MTRATPCQCRGQCYTPYTCGLHEHGRTVDTKDQEPSGVWFCGDEPEEPATSKTNIGTRVLWFAFGMAFVFTLILSAGRG